MFAEERHDIIIRTARRHGRVDVASLAGQLTVTPETVRRDLTLLERAGKVRRVHGGAIPVERFGLEPSVAARTGTMSPEKTKIARAALAEVPEAGSILLDAGTTTRELASMLPTDRELLVVVNSPALALMLADQPNLEVLMLGGRLRARTLAVVDDWTTQLLRNVCVDVAFVATNGVTPEYGLTTPDPNEAHVKRAMIAAAHRVVLLADHTKIGVNYFASFAQLDDVDLLITDSSAEPELVEQLEEAGLQVLAA